MDQVQFSKYTSFYSNKQVSWRHPNDWSKIVKYCKTRKQFITYDNRNIVPYNPGLLLKYNCHLYFDICTTKIASVRYIFKYILKGEDYAAAKLRRKEAVEKNSRSWKWDWDVFEW